jgi:hypothetical protein
VDDARWGQADGWYIDDVAIYDYDTTAPTFGAVTPSNIAYGSYVYSTFDLTTVFTDPQSRVTTCQYSTDGGSTWHDAVVSGTGSTNICTKTGITAANGQVLNLTMQATSFGGTSTAAVITVTGDTQPPTNGTLATTAGDNKLTLNWSGISDNGSGLRVANAYKLVRSAAATPNATCTNGTQVYLGNALTTQDSGLTNRTTYYYRLCAYDNIGNVSAGATATGRPLPPQTITFNPFLPKHLGDADFDPGATASSGLPVSYSSNNSAVATIVNGKVHIVGVGTATITASQSGIGNGDWLPASSSHLLTVIQQYSLTINIVGGGTVNNFNANSPPFTPCNHASCTDYFDAGSQFTLSGSPSVSFVDWTGVNGCSTGNCLITLNNNTSVTATFVPIFKIVGDTTPYQSLQSAYDSAIAQNLTSPVLMSRNFQVDGSFDLHGVINVILLGGYTDTGFTTATDYTTLNGSISVTDGSLVVDRLIIK